MVKVHRLHTVVENPFLRAICLHWSSASPIQAEGAYSSARFPPVHGIAVQPNGLADQADAIAQPDGSGDQNAGTVTRVFDLRDDFTADFNAQSDPLPAVTGAQSRMWVNHDIPQAVQLSAINSTDVQRENNNAFYAGIFFGIAGGALVAVITELVGPLTRRKPTG